MTLPIPQNIFPIMGKQSIQESFAPIDLSVSNTALPDEVGYTSLTDYVNLHISQNNSKYAIGGYLEHRNLYGLSNHFSGSDRRDIHLGIDIWTEAYHPIYAPISGKIHSYAYNDQHLDYGYTLILRHEYEDTTFYTLYGHLSEEYHDSWKLNQIIESGTLIATIGDRTTNGGWPPHLHFQLIIDIDDWEGDYLGVCSKSDLNYYANNCPSPKCLIKTKPDNNI